MTLPQVEFPVKIDQLAAYSGDDFVIEFNLFDIEGVPVSFAGYSDWKAQARPSVDSSTVVNFAIDASDAASGIIVLTLTGAQTNSMDSVGMWGYDLQVSTDINQVVTLAAGSFLVSPDWTR